VKTGWATGCREDTLAAAEVVELLPRLGTGALDEAAGRLVGSAGCVEEGADTEPLAAGEGRAFSSSFFSSSSSSSEESESSLDEPAPAVEGLLSGESGLSGPSSSSSSSSPAGGIAEPVGAEVVVLVACRRTRLGKIWTGDGRRSW
jgi:hypothetical protein